MMPELTNYTQGYSASTTASHASRTVASDAAFLVPYIKPSDKILDVGCGPGTITVGFCNYVPEGSVVGIDLSESVLQSAAALARQLRNGDKLKGDVSFRQGDLLKSLPFEDDTFDIVYASQLFPHLPPPDMPLQALKEMRRVLKPGGIVATRDAAAQHFFPQELDLGNLLTKNLLKGVGASDWPGPTMVTLYRRAGFDVDGGKVKVGCGTTCHADAQSRRWWADQLIGRLKPGDAFRSSWIKAGVPEKEIDLCVDSLDEWAKTEDAWYGILQSEMIAWK
ncbi:S-adenosyl-L-methionine-dependent methyltransferase [Xylariales sp. AK1849]|nr:S-adenosyl-L-methionine-dependent methyltransferase [Xylariales sp. AK1849]